MGKRQRWGADPRSGTRSTASRGTGRPSLDLSFLAQTVEEKRIEKALEADMIRIMAEFTAAHERRAREAARKAALLAVMPLTEVESGVFSQRVVASCPGCWDWSVEFTDIPVFLSVRLGDGAVAAGEAIEEHRETCPALDMLLALRLPIGQEA